MATWKDFEISVVQTGVFTPEHSAFVSGKAVGIILQNFPDLFGGMMQVLPLPAAIPPEIPRVILASLDGNRRLTMSPSRIDLVLRNTTNTSADLTALSQECSRVLVQYVKATGVRFDRLALIVSRFQAVQNPAQALIDRFCNEQSKQGPFRRSETFEIYNHKVYSLPREKIDRKVNSLVRCKTEKLLDGDKPVIVVEQDINTQEPDQLARPFPPEELEAFFQVSAAEAEEILKIYFPA